MEELVIGNSQLPFPIVQTIRNDASTSIKQDSNMYYCGIQSLDSNHFLPSHSSLRIHVPSTYQHEVFKKYNKFKKESDTKCKESGNFREIKNNVKCVTENNTKKVIGNGSRMEYKEKEYKNVKNVIFLHPIQPK